MKEALEEQFITLKHGGNTIYNFLHTTHRIEALILQYSLKANTNLQIITSWIGYKNPGSQIIFHLYQRNDMIMIILF